MLKSGQKRRRTQRQITDEKAEEVLRQRAIEDKLASIEKLQQELKEAKEEASQGKAATTILTQMLEKGEAQMDQNGNISVNSQMANQNQISEHSQSQQESQMNEDSQLFNI